MSSGVTWRVEATRPRLGRRVLFKASYRCQHRVTTSSTRSKNTCCEAKMHVTLKRTREGMSKSNDPHMPDLPLEVRISNSHNHNLYVADALRYRDVGKKAIEVLTGLFELGHTPTTALAVLKHDLQMEKAEYVKATANREICPDLKFAQRFEKYLKYTEKLFNRRECWALSYRGSLLTRGNNTNNLTEAAMRVLKDRILQRTKAFNPPQLLDLLTSRLEVYYETRIVDIALGRWTSCQRSRFLPIDTNIPASQIQQLEEKKFRVQGSKDTYTVDMQVELCSCPAGQTGVPCKHLAAVDKHFTCSSSLLLPKDAATRAELLKLTGAEIPLDFLQPLRLTQLEALPGPSAAGASQEQEHLVEPDSGDASIVENMMEDLKRRGQEDPLFFAGLVRMAKQHQLLKSNPAKLLSAIHTFGRSSHTSRRAAALRRAARRQGPMIACQPTAVARRKVSSGSKRRVSAGRPVKRHSLNYSVALNTSLAKNTELYPLPSLS
ncbi:hypothetical protein GJAV_G00107270 [Gymnothorax javanicus]|nr:hypothetical protein GJAV_G00107270 [Gymnothorax javanicus]